MFKKKPSMIAVSLVAVSLIASACMNNANNNGQVRQQGTQMHQTQYRQHATTNDRVQIANAAANRITQIRGVRQANVLITNRNAYVAAAVDTNGGQLTRKLEDQIARQVRSADPSILNVYVSTNPEFMDHVNQYVADVNQGRPVGGFFEEFGEMVQRIFPTAR